MKSDELEYIFELCRFLEDPNVQFFEEIFYGVEFPNLGKLNDNKDTLIKKLLADVPSDVRRITSAKELAQSVEQDIPGEGFAMRSRRFVTLEPLLIDSEKGFMFEGNSFGAQRIYMGDGFKFEEVSIHSPTYLQDGAWIEFSFLQAERRAQFLGYGGKLSNVRECRGLFASGYQIAPKGRINTYLHANSVNNLIGGAGSDLCVGVNMMNHSEEGEPLFIINPVTKQKISTPDKKIPVIFGMNASVGAGTLIDCATIVGANQKVSGIPRIKGLFEYGMAFLIKRMPSHEIQYVN